MKKLFAVIISAAVVLSTVSCGKTPEQQAAASIPVISPENLLTVETVASMTGGTLRMSDSGVTTDGNGTKVTYITEPLGAADSVSIRIEQFSDTLSASQVWHDYEAERVKRSDMEFISGIGEDCYIAYPYINVYFRGCYLRISGGSGNDEYQKNFLISMASNAVASLENLIPADAVSLSSDNVIQ